MTSWSLPEHGSQDVAADLARRPRHAARGVELCTGATRRWLRRPSSCALLAAVPLERDGGRVEFEAMVGGLLKPARLEIFQVNLGKLCNMTCRHCHVDAGPGPHRRDDGRRDRRSGDRRRSGAPARTRWTSPAARRNCTRGSATSSKPARDAGKHVMDRCNLTVLLLPRNAGLVDWFAERGVEVVASLPHYRRPNTDAQRGDGVFERSMRGAAPAQCRGLRQGRSATAADAGLQPGRRLPRRLAGDASSASGAKSLRARATASRFDRLFVLNNMPISRFLEWLETTGNLEAYMQRLVNAFNPAAVERRDVPQHAVGRLGRPALRLRLQPDARPRAGAARRAAHPHFDEDDWQREPSSPPATASAARRAPAAPAAGRRPDRARVTRTVLVGITAAERPGRVLALASPISQIGQEPTYLACTLHIHALCAANLA